MKLEGGLGLSLVNKIPEELIFASLTGINVHYTHLSSSQVLELSVQDVQVTIVWDKLRSCFSVLIKRFKGPCICITTGVKE